MAVHFRATVHLDLIGRAVQRHHPRIGYELVGASHQLDPARRRQIGEEYRLFQELQRMPRRRRVHDDVLEPPAQ